MLARFAHLTNQHRWAVIGAWTVLTLFGAFAAGQVSNRWYQGLAIPGGPAYEASQRTLHASAPLGSLNGLPLLADSRNAT